MNGYYCEYKSQKTSQKTSPRKLLPENFSNIPLWPIFEQLFLFELGNESRCHHYRWLLLLVELDVGSIYPNPVLGFGKFWSIPNKIGTHFRMALDNWMSLINLLSNAYVSAGGRPVTADATCPHSNISQKRTKSSEDRRK